MELPVALGVIPAIRLPALSFTANWKPAALAAPFFQRSGVDSSILSTV